MWRVAASNYCSRQPRGRDCVRRVASRRRPSSASQPIISTLVPNKNNHHAYAVASFSTKSNGINHNNKQQQQQQQNVRRNKTSRPSGSASRETGPRGQTTQSAAIIASFAKELQSTLRQAEAIPGVMPWNKEQNNESIATTERVEIFHQTLDLWQHFLQHVQEGSIRPQGKHRRETSIFCETLLRLYAQSEHDSSEEDSNDNVWHACRSILDFLRHHNLTVQEEHCQSALTVAVRYGFYDEAAALFRQQIDPDQSGYRPYRSMSVAEPVGLYALAKDTQARKGAVVENVMHAVHQLCMVSPSDQDLYVLAAGTALGHVGEGPALLDYLKTSLEAPRLGPVLVAATMQACLLSNHAAEAWTLYEERRGGTASEWQWSGGQEQLPHICTDLALRAAPAIADSLDPTQVLAMYNSLVQGGRAVSVEALMGIMQVLEQQGALIDAVQLWFYLVTKVAQGQPILVYGDELSCPDIIEDQNDVSHNAVRDDLVRELSHVVVPLLRTCQGAQEYALGLMCLSLWQGCFERREAILADKVESNSWIRQLHYTIEQSSNADDFLAATMASLSSFDLPSAACDLFDACAGLDNDDTIEKWPQSQDLRVYTATQNSQFTRLQQNRRMATLGDEIQRFSLVLSERDSLSTEDSLIVASALASIMESLTYWSQPGAALFLFQFLMDKPQSATSYADVPDIVSKSSRALPLTDSLAASVVQAYARLDDAETAMHVYDLVIRGSQSSTGYAAWPLTATAAMKILFASNNIDDAMFLFQEVAAHSQNPDLYAVAARSLSSHGRWKDVSDVYRLAFASRALSEEVSLLAMKAIDILKPPERMRLLRSIAEEAASLTGMTPLAWTERQYHGLRNMISFSTLRKLLWWNDPKTAYLDELELALGQWEARKATVTDEGAATAPVLPSIRIILRNAKRLTDASIPMDKTKIPHVPRNVSAWKSLVDEIVKEIDWNIWHTKAGRGLIKDVIEAYRNLGSDHDCLAFTFQCLENEIVLGDEALEAAISAADAVGDASSAHTLRMIASDGAEFA